jgi:hypothetical protein
VFETGMARAVKVKDLANCCHYHHALRSSKTAARWKGR